MTAEKSDLSAGSPCVGHGREEARVVQETAVGSSWRGSCCSAGAQVESPLLGILMLKVGRWEGTVPLLSSPASKKRKR